MTRKLKAVSAAVLLASVAALANCHDTTPTKPPPPSTFEPVGPEVYVAKVKQLLVGLPPTDQEVQAVKADPNALRGLIDQWMAMPEYEAKMLTFFQLAFQQTQITEADFVDMLQKAGIGNGPGVPGLVQNIKESYARTVLELVKEGQPLGEAMRSKRVMMTPPLMEFYAFMDGYHVDDNAKVTDDFSKNPGVPVVVETAQGPIPISETLDPQSPNYMHWYNPDAGGLTYATDPSCNNIDPIVFPASGYVLHWALYGGIFNHQGPNGNCGSRAGKNGVQFQPADFTTWKMVTIRTPNKGEATTKFYDIPALRSANELVINSPRLGFFSTPAFFANWSTNSSNQMRVTLNQSLIVATGQAVDGTDATIPNDTPGLDSQHASPGSPCYSCHQTLDPTRAILQSTYSWFYSQQTAAPLIAQKGLFAFQGVVQPVSSIDDFADILATHPLLPTAWTQKLCYYANSQPCLEDDPEFIRVVGVFQSSNMSWNVLVKELLSSPLTTNASPTKTTEQSQVVAVVRRDHLCAALNNRLGLSDVCKLDTQSNAKASTISEIVSGLPSDGYGRGSTVPVLPNQATLFYRAGLENVCEAVSMKVIDATPDPTQPNAKNWSSAQPDAAIADFVQLIMALTTSDARSMPATQILTSHYQAAIQAGNKPTDALRSTFVAACLAPTAIGIGM